MKHMSPKRSFFTILILTGFISALAALPAHADEWSKNLYPHRQARSPRRHFRRQHPRLHLGSERDRSQSHHQGGWAGHKLQDWERRSRGRASKMAIRWNSTCAFRVAPSSSWDTASVDIDIQMPREGRVDLHTSDGKIDLANFKGEMQLRSGDGSQESTTSMANCEPPPAMATFAPTAALTNSNSRPAMAALKRGPQPARPCLQAGGLESGDGTRHPRSAGKPRGRSRSPHRRWTHRSGYASHHLGQDSPDEVRGKMNGGGNLLVISYRRWIDPPAEGVELPRVRIIFLQGAPRADLD